LAAPIQNKLYRADYAPGKRRVPTSRIGV